MRTVSASLTLALVLATAPAAAQNANPAPYLPDAGPGSAFPRTGDRWLYAVRAPAGRGQDRFTRIDAVPARGGGSWTVTVTCGLVSTLTGRETGVIVGKGTMGRGRLPGIGGNWIFPGTPRTGGGIEQAVADGDRLDLVSVFSDTRCASGRGDLSSGD